MGKRSLPAVLETWRNRNMRIGFKLGLCVTFTAAVLIWTLQAVPTQSAPQGMLTDAMKTSLKALPHVMGDQVHGADI